MTKTYQLPQMVYHSTSFLCLFFLFCTCLSGQVDNNTEISEMPDSLKEERTGMYKEQLEHYLQQWIIEDYPDRADKAWNRDYSSIDAFMRSVEGNRERWMALLNPPELRKTGNLSKEPHTYLQDLGAEWIELPLGPVTAQGILAFPAGASSENPVPLIVVQHGIGSYPETPFSDDRYVSFMVVDEEHAFFRGWLTEFTDSDVVSLICPRPLMVHHGKSDRIGSGVPFLERWLMP